VELCRFYYDSRGRAESEEEHATEMADRLRLALVQSVSDERLRAGAQRPR
jgi:hypothetical protein